MSLLSALFIAGCGTTTESAIKQFSSILNNAMPFVQESEDWEAYSLEITKKGIIYGTATAADKQFVSKKMDNEYPAAVDRLSRPFAVSKKTQKELDSDIGYRFKYNQVMPVKDKKTSNIIGYCVNFDVAVLNKGKATPSDSAGNVTQSFIYVAKDRPISVTTVSADFTKLVCGDNFYKKYKDPNA